MKIKNYIAGLALALVAGIGAFAGIASSKSAKTVAADEALTVYYRGTGNGWACDTTKPVVFGGGFVEFTFAKDEMFKFATDSWSTAYGYLDANGSAFYCFSGAENDNWNFICEVAGTYRVCLNSSTNHICIDFLDGEEFFYAGSDTSWSEVSAKPLAINGAAQKFELTAGSEFKIKLPGVWNNALGYSRLLDNFYHCFAQAENDDNILVQNTDTYLISLRTPTSPHILRISIQSEDGKMYYVLDLNGNLLNEHHYGHFYQESGKAGTDWPGIDLSTYSGHSNIYFTSVYGKLDEAIFSDGTTQTISLSLADNAGKCLILTWSYDDVQGKWDSSTWLSLDAAAFISDYMKFAVAHENDEGTGLCKSESWYAEAKAVFNVLNDDVKAEIMSFEVVEDRLSAWAAANGDSFDVVSNTFVKLSSIRTLSSNETNSVTVTIIVAVAVVNLLGLTALLVLKKKSQK